MLAGRAGITPPLEYASTQVERRAWYRTLVCALSSDPAEGAVVMHIDVSDRRQTEETLARWGFDSARISELKSSGAIGRKG